MLDYVLEIKPGSVLTFRLQVSNRRQEVCNLCFNSSQDVDFVVERSGQEVWRWSADRAFAMMMREKQLRGGQKLAPYEAKWLKIDNAGQPVQPGTYLVKAYFFGVSRSVPVAQAEIRVD
jgi:hypothetical protein